MKTLMNIQNNEDGSVSFELDGKKYIIAPTLENEPQIFQDELGFVQPNYKFITKLDGDGVPSEKAIISLTFGCSGDIPPIYTKSKD